MKIIPAREKCGLAFLIYANIHIILALVYDNMYENILFNITSIYGIVDAIWILFESVSKTPKYELVMHHLACIALVTSGIHTSVKLKVMLIEISTLFLMLRRYTSGFTKKLMHTLFTVSWFGSRIIWLYLNLIHLKATNKLPEFRVNALHYISYMIIYLLGIKWTAESMGIVKYESYTSIALSMPIYFYTDILTTGQFISIFTLMISSSIHHLMRNKYSLSFDSFGIVFTCLTFLNINWIISIVGAVIAASEPLLVTSSDSYVNNLTRMVYTYTAIHFCNLYSSVTVPVFLCGVGFIRYMTHFDPLLWHLANGFYLSHVTYLLQRSMTQIEL